MTTPTHPARAAMCTPEAVTYTLHRAGVFNPDARAMYRQLAAAGGHIDAIRPRQGLEAHTWQKTFAILQAAGLADVQTYFDGQHFRNVYYII